jgi:hypothetical protein
VNWGPDKINTTAKGLNMALLIKKVKVEKGIDK